MVELVGVEPMTYTMRTYRSSQLSYSPILNDRQYYMGKNQKIKLNSMKNQTFFR